MICAYDGCSKKPHPGRDYCHEHAGGVTREERIEYAVYLRAGGLRFDEIAKKLEVSPATVSEYMFEADRWDLWHADYRELDRWRAAAW